MTFDFNAGNPRMIRNGKSPDLQPEQPSRPKVRKAGKQPDTMPNKAKPDKQSKPLIFGDKQAEETDPYEFVIEDPAEIYHQEELELIRRSQEDY